MLAVKKGLLHPRGEREWLRCVTEAHPWKSWDNGTELSGHGGWTGWLLRFSLPDSSVIHWVPLQVMNWSSDPEEQSRGPLFLQRHFMRLMGTHYRWTLTALATVQPHCLWVSQELFWMRYIIKCHSCCHIFLKLLPLIINFKIFSSSPDPLNMSLSMGNLWIGKIILEY